MKRDAKLKFFKVYYAASDGPVIRLAGKRKRESISQFLLKAGLERARQVSRKTERQAEGAA